MAEAARRTLLACQNLLRETTLLRLSYLREVLVVRPAMGEVVAEVATDLELLLAIRRFMVEILEVINRAMERKGLLEGHMEVVEEQDSRKPTTRDNHTH